MYNINLVRYIDLIQGMSDLLNISLHQNSQIQISLNKFENLSATNLRNLETLLNDLLAALSFDYDSFAETELQDMGATGNLLALTNHLNATQFCCQLDQTSTPNSLSCMIYADNQVSARTLANFLTKVIRENVGVFYLTLNGLPAINYYTASPCLQDGLIKNIEDGKYDGKTYIYTYPLCPKNDWIAQTLSTAGIAVKSDMIGNQTYPYASEDELNTKKIFDLFDDDHCSLWSYGTNL
jgi:hypothetical protein